MTTVMPQSELVRKAVQYISECRKETPDTPVHALVEKAGMRFNLSPKECENLSEWLKDNPE